jgi:hypothetical protein
VTKARIALLLLVQIGFCVPLLALVPCAEEDGTGDCDTDCALCACCSHGPQVAPSCVDPGPTGLLSDPVRIPDDSLPSPPRPWDVLHVPRPASPAPR